MKFAKLRNIVQVAGGYLHLVAFAGLSTDQQQLDLQTSQNTSQYIHTGTLINKQ